MRIYISSTSEDLADHRLAVISALQRSGHTPLCMEHHPAGDRAPKEECLKEVAGCDAYVGIFAWRYGFIPSNSEMSITELEYREALKYKIPTLLFLLTEKIEWPDKFRESGVNGERIKKLRNELQLSKWIRFFSSPDNLSTEVLAAISVVTAEKMREEFAKAQAATRDDINLQDVEFRKLWEEQKQAEDKRKRKKRTRIPFSIPERLIQHFQDRDTELSKLKQYLSNKNLKMVLICGRGGMGKTTLIVKLLRELKEEFDEQSLSTTDAIDSIVFVPLGEKGYRTPDRIVELISRTLEPEAAEELNEVWSQECPSIRERLVELFRGPLVQSRCLIVLDNLESVLDEENRILPEYDGLRQFIDVCLEYDHASIIVVTSRRTLSLSPEAEIAAIGRRVQIPLDEGLPENFAIALLRELDSDGSKGLKEAANEVLRDIVRRCQCIPRTLETLFATLLQKPTWTLKTLLENQEYLSRLIENPARELFASLQSDQQRLVMQALSVYDKPVPSIAIRSILPALSVDEILDGLYRNFVVNHDQGQFWLHPLDKEYAYSQIPDNQCGFSKSELHKGAADFYKKLHKPVDSWKSIEDVESQLQEFRHLVRASHYDDACQIINEIDREYLAVWGYFQQIIELRLQLVDNIKDSNLAGWNLGHLGSAYLDSGDPAKAKFYYEKALPIAIETKDKFLECRVLGNLALAEGSLGDRNKEETLLADALSIANEIKDRLHEGRWLGGVTSVKLALGHISASEAIANYILAISIANEIHDQRFVMMWSDRLGDIYIGMRDFENSKVQLNTALDMSRKISARWQTCQILPKLGNIYRQMGDRNQELKCYEQTHEVVREMSNYYHQFNVLIWLASKYAEMALNREQLKCYEEIQIILSDVDDHSAKHGLLLYLGDQLLQFNNKEKAVEVYNQALESARVRSDSTNLFLASLRLANLYNIMKQTAKAVILYDLALQTAHNTDNRAGEVIVLIEYANLLLITGEALKAIKYYERTLPFVEEMNDKLSQLTILNRMGMAAFFMRNMMRAIEYYEKSLTIAREIQSKDNESVALFNIGDAYHQMGDIEKAIPYYKDSLALDSISTNYKCMIGLGISCYHTGQLVAGKSYFENCIQILSPYRADPNLFYPQLAALGVALLAIGRNQEATNLYIQCLQFSPPKEHIYYALQDLFILQRVPLKIVGLSGAINLLEGAFSQMPSPDR